MDNLLTGFNRTRQGDTLPGKDGFCVTDNQTGTGGIAEKAAAGKAPEQDHDQ